MLVLSRKATEKIHIGDDITVEIRRIAGNRVTVAIDAPRDVRILRGELEKIAKEFEDAGNPSPPRAAGNDAYVVKHVRMPMPRLHSPAGDSQAVG